MKIKKIVKNSDGSVRLLDESAQDSHDEGQEDWAILVVTPVVPKL